MSVDFGSPGAGDATAKIERDIIRQAHQYADDVRRGALALNRPIGSKVKVSPEEEKADWQLRVSDPEALKTEFDQQAQVVGEFYAELYMREWDKACRDKYGEPPPLPIPEMPPEMGGVPPPMPVMGAEGMTQ